MKEVTFKQLKELEEIKHQNTLEELKFTRVTENIKHQNNLEHQRIKSAEIRKEGERRFLRYGRH